MPTIKKDYIDDTKVPNSMGIEHLVHDSEMPWSEVSKLVLDIKGLLAGKTFDDKDDLAFKNLKEILDSADGVITVTKGIHQRETNPHITFETAGDDWNAGYEWHLDLAESRHAPVLLPDGTEQEQKHFQWKAAKVSVCVVLPETKGGKVLISHPPGAITGYVSYARARRWSLTEKQMETHAKRVIENWQREADEKEKARLEAEAIAAKKAAEIAAAIAKTEDNFPSLMGSGPTNSRVQAPRAVTKKPVVKSTPQPRRKLGQPQVAQTQTGQTQNGL